MPIDHKLAKQRWEEVYQAGDKYLNASPLPFVGQIKDTIKEYKLQNGRGLYIGCGNGRNYIPLAESGLSLVGLDISQHALDQLRQRMGMDQSDLVCSDFESYKPNQKFDYIVSIQVFQHGNWEQVQKNFKKVEDLLNPGGLFFLRVKSINMPTKDPHRTIEQTPHGGFSAHFTGNKKAGLDIHYYSEAELNGLMSRNFQTIVTPHEIIEMSDDKSIRRAHLEAIWRKEPV